MSIQTYYTSFWVRGSIRTGALEAGKDRDWKVAVDDFTASSGRAQGAMRDLDRLLATETDDRELDQTIATLGCYYLPEAAGTGRWWLTAIRDRLSADVGRAR